MDVYLVGKISRPESLRALVLGPLFFLIYINDLTEDISSNVQLFADDVALFVKVRDPENAYLTLKNDRNTISKWANTWKMQFNPDPTKPATENIFSHKRNKPVHPVRELNFANWPQNDNFLAFQAPILHDLLFIIKFRGNEISRIDPIHEI